MDMINQGQQMPQGQSTMMPKKRQQQQMMPGQEQKKPKGDNQSNRKMIFGEILKGFDLSSTWFTYS